MTDGTPGDDTDMSKNLLQRKRKIGISFQSCVDDWMQACFGKTISADTIERNHRFLEESLELVQACGCTASEAHQLVDYVFGRPVGDKPQEVGGVMVTLAALCEAQRLSMIYSGWKELDRCWANKDKIRAKQAAKPKHSPLPRNAITVKIKADDLDIDEIAINVLRHVMDINRQEATVWLKTREWENHPLYQWGQRKIGKA